MKPLNAALMIACLVLAAGPAAAADERWRGADKDGDGMISRDEAKAGMPRVSENFDQLDADGDGRVSRDEMHRSMQQQRQQGQGGKKQRGTQPH